MKEVAPIVSFFLVVLVFAAIVSSVINSVPLQLQLFESGDYFGVWAPMVHRTHNAFLLWQESILFSLPGFLFEGGHFTVFHYATLAKLSIFFLGLWVLLLALRVAEGAAVLSASFTLLLYLLFGWDNVLLSSFSLVPALFVCFWSCNPEEGKAGRVGILGSILTVSLLCHFSNQLSLMMVLFCFFTLLVRGRLIGARLCLVLLLIPVLHQSLVVQTTMMSDYYPALGRVVADDGLVGIIRPFIGQDLPISVIDYQSIETRYSRFSMFLAILFTSLFLGLYWLNPVASRWFGIASLFAVAACLESLPYSEFRLIMPLAVLSRIVPNSFLFPLVSIALVFSLLWALLGLWRLYHPYVVTGCYFLLSIFLFAFQIVWTDFGTGLVQQPLVDRSFNQKLSWTAIQEKGMTKATLVSPSYQLFRTNGPGVIEMAGLVDYIQFNSVDTLIDQITSSHKSENSWLAVDGKMETRWFSGIPGQTGKETFSLKFHSPKEFDGVFLDLGTFSTDFPRGLSIAVSETCDGLTAEPERIIYSEPIWQGRIMVSKKGYPYYGSQSEVKVMFSAPIKAQCVFFQQLAEAPVFEWSIAEIKFHFVK